MDLIFFLVDKSIIKMKNNTSTRWPKKITVSYSPCLELASSSLLLIYQKSIIR
jgi:hypothetical protein